MLLWEDGEYIELGSLSGPTAEVMWATDMNDRGQVVGTSSTPAGDQHAFLWQDGEMRDLDGVAGRQSRASAIGDRGHVAGVLTPAEDPFGVTGFLWWCGEMVELSRLWNPYGSILVNSRGQVVGSAVGSAPGWRTMLFTPGLDAR